MSVITGKSVKVARPAAEVYAKISDLGQYKAMVDRLPDDVRAKIQGVEFTPDSIIMDAPGMGRIEFKVTELREPTHVGLTASGSPVPLKLVLDLEPDGDAATTVVPGIDVDLPPMLRPLLKGKLSEAADKFGEVFTKLF